MWLKGWNLPLLLEVEQGVQDLVVDTAAVAVAVVDMAAAAVADLLGVLTAQEEATANLQT